ncbi:Tetratricopeptide repeat protein 31 [Channa argus]|uniref:Tetratricopeptide repeat protein 31 n=1 Tax=Channa argus TaxID=215402 RepID=A0A6G1QFC1_CHAAH|nr:Tetratricopeptide repeat protein 31 [Channa argus]
MSRKKEIVARGAPRFRENSTLMHTHISSPSQDNFVDFINGRRSEGSFLNVLGIDFLRTFGGDRHDDLNSDDYDDDDDNFIPRNAAYKPLQPHPRIRQLTDEEADKYTKEMIDEKERRKEKTEKNKRKKLRKKEKKRLEKGNAVKDILPEEELKKSESSNQKRNIIETNVEENESSKTPNLMVAMKCEEKNGDNKEGTVLKINKNEDGEQKELDLNNSYASTAKSVPEETCNQKPTKERKKEKSKLVGAEQPNEEKPNTVGKPDVQKKTEEKHESKKESTMDPTAEEYAKRSRELAAMGYHLADSGQYEMAVKCFTDAIKFNPKEFKLFGNRSLCYERMQQYENALRDADLALCMEPNWIKGLFRKGKALCGLKKYYEASLIYMDVLKLNGSSAEAKQELKRAQTLHLMEMGFSWEQSLEALKTHSTLEEAVEALFSVNACPADASKDHKDQPVVQEDDDYDEGEWTVQQTSRSRTQQIKESDCLSQSRSESQSPTPHSRSLIKPELFSIWVGSLAPAVTYTILHELFSRVGVVYSIKMLLEHQCAFVNYTKKEDCDRAIQNFNGLVVEGAPLSVRYPNKFHTALGSSHKKECFFWRTTGCTRQDCTYKHVPEHKNIDKDKFTSRLGHFYT